MKTQSFAHKIGESALAGVGRNKICEYLLFETALARRANTKSICLERKRPFQIEDIDYTGPKFSKQDWPTNHVLNRRYSVG